MDAIDPLATAQATYSDARPEKMISSTCDLCGAVVSDWWYTTDYKTGERESLPRVNHERHAAFHARLGF